MDRPRPRVHKDTLHIAPAAPRERDAALRLVFSHFSKAERDLRTSEILAQIRADDRRTAMLWVARRGRRVVGALWAPVLPGRSSVLSLPRVASGESPTTARDLVAEVVRALAAAGVRVAQALSDTDHGPEIEALTANGFGQIANLQYLVSLAGTFPTSPPTDHLDFAPSPALHERLANLVEQTYQGSLDCPAIDGLRDIEDVLAGYRASGVFDPDRWLIVAREGSDVGCLLLADYPASHQWELVYMGLVREARGRGFGLAMVRHAQWMARQAGCERITLAVDATNSPAIAVYAAAGFVAWDLRSVWVRTF